jgi:hypothetical protein
MTLLAEVPGPGPATGAEKAHELILAVLFAEVSRVAPLCLERAASVFDEIAAETVDGAEARVYQKFAMVLRKHDKAKSSSAPNPRSSRQLRVVNGGKLTSADLC